jgi:hypothetical protein
MQQVVGQLGQMTVRVLHAKHVTIIFRRGSIVFEAHQNALPEVVFEGLTCGI